MEPQPSWTKAALTAFERQESAMALIPEGRFRPLYTPATAAQELAVRSFYLDRDPVTNEDFLRFAKLLPSYRRGRISPLFADGGYLAHWAEPTVLGPRALPDQPVVGVSWFAARAFCQARGKRLPTELEWEYAASASTTQGDARDDEAFREQTLRWYATPANETLPSVGRSTPNYYGVRDLHGLVWEWVLDWNSTLVSSDSRTGKSADTQAFCGAGALAAGDVRDYASFMRTAFRGSLQATYTTRTLGFRCAKDAEPRP
jgi:sulfatase modifying factor 1